MPCPAASLPRASCSPPFTILKCITIACSNNQKKKTSTFSYSLSKNTLFVICCHQCFRLIFARLSIITTTPSLIFFLLPKNLATNFIHPNLRTPRYPTHLVTQRHTIKMNLLPLFMIVRACCCYYYYNAVDSLLDPDYLMRVCPHTRAQCAKEFAYIEGLIGERPTLCVNTGESDISTLRVIQRRECES